MSLELDRRNDLPIPREPDQAPYKYQSEKGNHVNTYPPGDPAPQTLSQQHARQKPLLRILSIALAVMTVLAAVAAGVGARVAEKRGRDSANLRKLLGSGTAQTNCTSPAGPQISGAAHINSTDTTTFNPISSPFQSSLVPTTNCTAMNGTYVTAWAQSVFFTECSMDYDGSDMLGVWVFTFADCMEACASWNARHLSTKCYTVSYDISNTGVSVENSGLGNCFLKDSNKIQGRKRSPTSSGSMKFNS